MLGRFADLIARRALVVVIVAFVLGVAAAVYGAGVARALAAGGFEVKDGEAARVADAIATRFGPGEPDLVVVVGSGGVPTTDAQTQAAIDTLITTVAAHPAVRSIERPIDATGAPRVSADGTTAMITIEVAGHAREKEEAYPELAELLHGGPADLEVAITGPLALAAVGQATAEHDLQRGELVAFPLVGVILLVFFRGRLATLLPLVVGALSIAFAAALLRGLSAMTEISIFAMNIVTLLGLGLAIDYSLFIVQRFREELVESTPRVAAVATVVTAGKTMLFSGIAVGASLLGLMAFPIALLHSIALAGALIVLLTVIASLTVLPALLVLLGRRIEWPRRRTQAQPVRRGRAWARIAEWVMRRPVLVATGTAALLLLMGSPVLRLQTGLSDARMFPADSEVRRAQRVLDAPEGFGAAGSARYVALLRADGPILEADALGRLFDTHAALAAAPDVREVQDLVLALGDGDRARFIAAGTMLGQAHPLPAGLHGIVDGETTVVTIVTDAPADADARARQIDRLRALAGTGFAVELGGYGKVAAEVDHELARGLLPAIAVVLLATLVVLTLAFGAIVVSLKAVLMNVVSLAASFGALVWVFQDGRFEGPLHYDSAGAIDPLVLVIMFAIVFGLSMDYELFLLSRIREAYDETGDARASVAAGLVATGSLFTMAALMLIVVLLGFGSGHILFVKQLGLGMALAVAVDATVVRALLVPASMRLLGRWNWWAPPWFERWWRRSGIGVRE